MAITRGRVHITKTEFSIDHDDYWESPAFDAMMAWFADHGVDAMTIPTSSILVRDPKAKTVSFDQVVKDALGRDILVTDNADDFTPVTKRVVLQLDRAPAPWPPEVVTFAKAARS